MRGLKRMLLAMAIGLVMAGDGAAVRAGCPANCLAAAQPDACIGPNCAAPAVGLEGPDACGTQGCAAVAPDLLASGGCGHPNCASPAVAIESASCGTSGCASTPEPEPARCPNGGCAARAATYLTGNRASARRANVVPDRGFAPYQLMRLIHARGARS